MGGQGRADKDSEAKLLKERTNEIGLVLTSSISALPGPVGCVGWRSTGNKGICPAFMQASAAAETGTAANATFALVRATPGGFRVVMTTGSGLHTGQVITDQRAQAFSER